MESRSNMIILTKAIKEKLIANHKEQDGTKSFKAVLKLFNPTGIGTWYLTEYSEVENNAFGYVTGLTHDEWGYVSLTELQSITLAPQVPRIERDMYFESVKFSELKLKKAG